MSLPFGKIKIKDGNFTDTQGRIIQLKGINVDGGAKYPRTPYFPSHVPVERNEGVFFDGDNVSFVGRPFPLDEAVGHLLRIKRLGYNTLRYVVTWEAIEHAGPGKYDEDFIGYTIELFKIIEHVGGMYVFIDPHQDVWSRYTGGDGAPLWTLYAAGMDPHNFNVTQSAILQNYFPQDPDSYPKMLWTTNYQRLITATMFTLFFAGKDFAPKCIINGVNIQDYLQSHYIGAITHFLQRIKDAAPHLFDGLIIGVENLNEPNGGYLGITDITEIPPDQQLKLGTCPTVFQSLRTGSGIATEIDEYKITVFGPRKTGTQYVDPEGVIAWLEDSSYDEHYNFVRGAEWNTGECIWAQHGVWEPETCEPLKRDYFSVHPETGDTVDEEYFINHYFVDHYRAYRKAVRDVIPDTMMFMQSPPLRIPPKLKGTDLIDDNTVFCPHYYDGMSLMFKTWNRRYNVDTYGLMRHKYSNPVFGMVFGENNIRNSFKKQLGEMKKEAVENLGATVPVIFTEIGSPFDMDDKKAYEDGDFSSQTSSLDALGYALEGNNLSHTWWNYTADNCHKWGDRFNSEDFSFWSVDDDLDDSTLPGSRSSLSGHRATTGFSDSDSTANSSAGGNFESTKNKLSVTVKATKDDQKAIAGPNQPSAGLRAVDSIIRPYCSAINGEFIDAFFDLKNLKYTLTIVGASSTDAPTKIYFPDWHFTVDAKIIASSGRYEFDEVSDDLLWYHGPGRQSIEITAYGSPDYLPKVQGRTCLDTFLSFLC